MRREGKSKVGSDGLIPGTRYTKPQILFGVTLAPLQVGKSQTSQSVYITTKAKVSGSFSFSSLYHLSNIFTLDL